MLMVLPFVMAVCTEIIRLRVLLVLPAEAVLERAGTVLVERSGLVDLCKISGADVDFGHMRASDRNCISI